MERKLIINIVNYDLNVSIRELPIISGNQNALIGQN